MGQINLLAGGHAVPGANGEQVGTPRACNPREASCPGAPTPRPLFTSKAKRPATEVADRLLGADDVRNLPAPVQVRLRFCAEVRPATIARTAVFSRLASDQARPNDVASRDRYGGLRSEFEPAS